jgi:hypothetical protein
MKKFVDVECPNCLTQVLDAFVTIPDYPTCAKCAEAGSTIQMTRLYLPSSVPNVVGDDIPGGVVIHHGVCNEDGTPKKYYSHSEIQKEATRRGLVNRPERGVADKKDWDRLSRRVR